MASGDHDGTLVGNSSPYGPFTKIGERLTFLGEQFWGRAARASNDSKESDARFLFPGNSILVSLRTVWRFLILSRCFERECAAWPTSIWPRSVG